MEEQVKPESVSPETVHLCEDVPVIGETDICVLGGSCTGVFAAVRAARLGAQVMIVEKQSHFGGAAPVTCT
jgi:heterodisulfide reductase subunit A-like polyferredoxin